MTPELRRIPDLLLEQYLTDSLDAAGRARLEASLADSPRDRDRLEELRADSAAFLIQHPPAPLVARYREENQRARWWRWPVLLAPALAAAVALVVFFRPPPINEDPTIPKGSVGLVLVRKTDRGHQELPPSGSLAPHDIVGFKVTGARSGFIAVLSRDGQGTVSVYYPFGGEAAAPYNAAQKALPEAVELDDTLGPEKVYVLNSAQPFELRWAVEALKAGRPLDKEAPPGVSVGSASFVKEPAAQK